MLSYAKKLLVPDTYSPYRRSDVNYSVQYFQFKGI